MRSARLPIGALLALVLVLEAGALVAEPAAGELPVGEIIEKIITRKNADQEYALYLPTGYGEHERLWPVLFVLDPRGRAVPGIVRFLPAAERHGYVILSSYQSRSDVPGDINTRSLNALLYEAQARYRLDPRRLYLSGLSGTAHAVWRFGQILEEHVAGVIAVGGGVQIKTQGPPGEAKFSYYGIAGTADFNYREMLSLEEHMLERGIDHRMVTFEGRHGWSPHEYTNRALDWMELQAVKRGLAAENPALVTAELERARAAAAAADDPLERLRRHRDIVRDFGGLAEVEADVAAVARLERDPRVKARRKQETRLAKEELAHISRWYRPWLEKLQRDEHRLPSVAESLVALRVGVLQEQAADLDHLPEAHSAQRILERLYTGVAFYHPRDFEADEDDDLALRSLDVAVAIFPERVSGVWRLASAQARAGREDAAFETLRRAIGFGRVDVERLKSDPTWEPLRNRPEWSELVAVAEKRAVK